MKELQPIDAHEWSGCAADHHFRGYCLDEEGTFFFQHSHDYSHPTLVATGALRAWIDGKHIGDFYAPAVIEVAAGKKHKFQALLSMTRFFCVHYLEGKPYQILEEHK